MYRFLPISKMVDITVFLYCITEKQCIDAEEQACLYLYDVKDTIGGKDVIFHLIEQWKAGITSALDFTRYIGDTKYRIGVITRDYNVKRVEKEITKCEEEIKKLDFREDITTTYKMQSLVKLLEESKNEKIKEMKIVFIIDEAHRTTMGTMMKEIKEFFKKNGCNSGTENSKGF